MMEWVIIISRLTCPILMIKAAIAHTIPMQTVEVMFLTLHPVQPNQHVVDHGAGARRRRRNDSPPWNWEMCNEDNFDPVDIPFTGREHIKVRMGDSPDPIDFFNLYITDELVAHFVTETNRYARQYI
jgi:hypothetical protein